MSAEGEVWSVDSGHEINSALRTRILLFTKTPK